MTVRREQVRGSAMRKVLGPNGLPLAAEQGWGSWSPSAMMASRTTVPHESPRITVASIDPSSAARKFRRAMNKAERNIPGGAGL
jgi:hypothetical protein